MAASGLIKDPLDSVKEPGCWGAKPSPQDSA